MNDDLISRQAAIDEIDEWIKAFRENGHKESAADACLIQDGIIQLPSAPPEIIRCKDCKFMEHAVNGRGEHGYCCNNSDSPVDNNRWLDADWFCADGEMESDGDNH